MILCFWDFTNFWVFLIYFKLLHLIHNSKGHKCSGLFCTKLQVLWFLTLFILPGKLRISLILTKFVCKVVLNKSIYAHLYQFCCFFRALWPVTTLVTGAPMPTYPIHWVYPGACAHGKVTIASFQPFTALIIIIIIIIIIYFLLQYNVHGCYLIFTIRLIFSQDTLTSYFNGFSNLF